MQAPTDTPFVTVYLCSLLQRQRNVTRAEKAYIVYYAYYAAHNKIEIMASGTTRARVQGRILRFRRLRLSSLTACAESQFITLVL